MTRLLVAEAGIFSLTGADAGVTHEYLLNAQTGFFGGVSGPDYIFDISSGKVLRKIGATQYIEL